MSETFKIEGLRELSKQLSRLGKSTGSKVLRSAAMTATLPVVKAAKADIQKGSRAHKTHTGRLVAPGFASRNVARRSSLSRDKRTAYVSIGVKREAFYAVSFLELGTKYIQKRPWLTKALEREQKNVVSRFGKALKKKIDVEARKK